MSQNSYSTGIRAIHWLMAVGFFFMWGSGCYMTTMAEEDSHLEELLFSVHISVGVTLLWLLMARIVVRKVSPPVTLSDRFSTLEKAGAHFAHISLYALPALIIVLGWAETDFGGYGVNWFGIEMPKLFPTRETFASINLELFTSTLHKWLAYLMLIVAVLHIAAVFKHRWVDGDDVLQRMMFNKPRN